MIDALARYWDGNPRALAWALFSYGLPLTPRQLEQAALHQIILEKECKQWFRK